MAKVGFYFVCVQLWSLEPRASSLWNSHDVGRVDVRARFSLVDVYQRSPHVALLPNEFIVQCLVPVRNFASLR